MDEWLHTSCVVLYHFVRGNATTNLQLASSVLFVMSCSLFSSPSIINFYYLSAKKGNLTTTGIAKVPKNQKTHFAPMLL